ncbi:MAG: DUF2807 domain-containing protein [Porphyromonas sp.]|nr:DUF2807 domain-containing protein [Porphyromonas sp.]
MKSKSIFSFVVVLLATLSSFGHAQIFSNNRRYELPEAPQFLEAERTVKVTVKHSNENYLELVSKPSDAKGAEIRVDNGRVRILGPKRFLAKKIPTTEFILYTTKPSLFRGFSVHAASVVHIDPSTPIDINNLAVEVSGASSFGCAGNIRSLDIDISGASVAKISGDFEKIECEVSGASSVNISGQTRLLELEVSAASTASFRNLIAKIGKVEVSGASSATTNVVGELYYGVYASSTLTNVSEKAPQIRRGESSGFSKFYQK